MATGRRYTGDAWNPGATNSTHWVEVDCGQARVASFVALDRGHNLAGKQIYLEGRNSTSLSWATVVVSTYVPSASYGALPSTLAPGVATPEGAWVREFNPTAFRYWRLRVPPSTGFAPRVVGLHLGPSWSPSNPAVAPYDADAARVEFASAVNPSGWQAAGRVSVVRSGAFRYLSETIWDDVVAQAFLDEYRRRRISWVIPQRSDARGAMMVTHTAGAVPNQWTGQMEGRAWTLPYVEHQPEVIR